MDAREKARVLGAALRRMRGERSLEAVAERVEVLSEQITGREDDRWPFPFLSVKVIRRLEAGTLFPDFSEIAMLVWVYQDEDLAAAAPALLLLELELLGVSNLPDLFDLVLHLVSVHAGREPFQEEGLEERLHSLGLTDRAVRDRVAGFLRGEPGEWGYVVNGRYFMDNGQATNPLPSRGGSRLGHHAPWTRKVTHLLGRAFLC